MTMISSEILALLSSLYLCRPTREAMANWKGLLSDDVPNALIQLKAAILKMDPHSEQDSEDLLWEYTRLFVGPYKLPCPPWESVYRSANRLMMQEACDDVIGFYDEMGLAVDNPDLMPDHVGVELNFLAVLHANMIHDPERKPYYMRIAKRFLDEHLWRWIPEFTKDMEEAADSAFYKSLAEVTRGFVLTLHDGSRTGYL
jgi:TorA maturation chaperone TorD